jgi:hypothetical protein
MAAVSTFPSAAFRLALLSATIFAGVHATKHTGVAYKQCAKEMHAQKRVAELLKEGQSGNLLEPISLSLHGWVPAVSLEAEQGMLPHQQLEREFRAQFEEVIGTEDIATFEQDLKGIMHSLEHTFASLAKNEYGDVGHTAVRYALHRLFVARHGWYISGLDPEGNSYSTSSPAEVLKGHVPDKVYTVVEKLLYGRGFGLHETAVLAAVLENLIHKEAIFRAAVVFELFDMDLEESHPAARVDFAIDHYMAAYIMGQDVTVLSKEQLLALMASMPVAYPGWQDTQKWIHSIRKLHGNGIFSFNDVVGVLTHIGEHYGTFQQKECVAMKKQLIELEKERNGCVPVKNFYKSMLDQGKWQFSESPDYLRELGALDESDPSNMRVMIPNYINGPSNCVASSSYYSVCCANECEEILGRVERQIQRPDASPEELADVVAMLPSQSVPANRTLSPPLLHHLTRIAELHGGQVPIHSRLFMQWMHNAYPHECAYPHITGKIAPRTPELWMATTGKASIASAEEMQKFVAANDTSTTLKSAQCGQWLEAEELYVPWTAHPHQRELETRDAHAWAISSSVALLGVLASTLLMVVHACKSLRNAANRPNKLVAA